MPDRGRSPDERPTESPGAPDAGALRRALDCVRRLLARALAARERAGPAPAAAPARVLLVEDDPLVARAVARMIERLGHVVTTCADGLDALARFRADPDAFDLVVTDESLPGLRGDRLAEALLALRPSLPVVICTGYSEHLDEERAHALGARALLLKPLDVAQLDETLRAALGPPR